MRRMPLMFAAMLAALVLGSGVAVAAAITGANGPDTLMGANKADEIHGIGGADDTSGKRGADELYAGGGEDEVIGGPGADEIHGSSTTGILLVEEGDDFINSADNGRQDVVNCGTGDDDRAIADDEDTVQGCEAVTVDLN